MDHGASFAHGCSSWILMLIVRVVLASRSIVPNFCQHWPPKLEDEKWTLHFFLFTFFFFCIITGHYLYSQDNVQRQTKQSLCWDFFLRRLWLKEVPPIKKRRKKNPFNTEWLGRGGSLISIIDAFHTISVFLREECLIHPRPWIFSLGRCKNAVLHIELCQYSHWRRDPIFHCMPGSGRAPVLWTGRG